MCVVRVEQNLSASAQAVISTVSDTVGKCG